MEKLRLDEWLVANGHYESRARAREAITRGCVSQHGIVLSKPAKRVLENTGFEIKDPAAAYVSRAALKLIHALDEEKIDTQGRVALDIGSSMGGFCQVLLERGCSHVFGVDVGHDQLHDRLKNRAKLTVLEGLNARELTPSHLENHQPEILTCDASFISLTLVLPVALDLAAPGATGIFLIKPQFEVGKKNLASGGIVRDKTLERETVEGIVSWLDTFPKWRVTGHFLSPIAGGDGNQEYLMIGKKDA